MNKFLTVLFAFFMAFSLGQADNLSPRKRKPTDANIYGHVISQSSQEHLPGITIAVKGTSIKISSDQTGHYAFYNLKPGVVTLVASGIGYKTVEKRVQVAKSQTKEIDFTMPDDDVAFDEVVVTANRGATLRLMAPALVSVLDKKSFDKTNANNLFQALPFQPGVRVEDNCQNCGFNQVRINGLDGKYSQILIDSRPVMGALAGVYGIEQIPTNMVERIEVIRGGGSALYGSSAIAGVINIITKEPTRNQFSFSDNLSFTGMKSPDNTLNMNASLVSPDNKMGAMIYAESRRRTPWDQNGDDFSEIGKLDSRAMGGHFFLRPNDQSRVSAEVHTIQEDRRGGDHLDWPDHVAQIAEHLRHYIYSGNLKYDLYSKDNKQHFQAYLAGQNIRRESYYGAVGYTDPKEGSVGHPVPAEAYGVNFGVTKSNIVNTGLQYSYNFDKLLFMPAELLVGTEYTYDGLRDVMPIRQWTPLDDKPTVSKFPETRQDLNSYGQLAQIEWKNDTYGILLGGRLDENNVLENPIFSPRITLRYNPVKKVNIRACYAKGFRSPQVFDEDVHVGLVNGEAVRIRNSKNLKPEISHTFSLSADNYFNVGETRCNLLVEGFSTIINDVFVTQDKENVGEGITEKTRENGAGAKVYGVNVEGRAVWRWLSVQAGLTFNHARYNEPESYGQRTTIGGKTDNGLADVKGGNVKFDKNEDGKFNTIDVTDNHYQRTPDLYGYFTVGIKPCKHFSIDLSGTYTGHMYAPHVIAWGTGTAVSDKAALQNGTRKEGVVDQAGNSPEWDMLVKTPTFFDMGVKLTYNFKIFGYADAQVFLGMSNIFNSYQNDFDMGGNRDSAYIYGPGLPRTGYAGLKFTL